MASSTPKGMVLRSQKGTPQAPPSNSGLRPIIKTPFRLGSKPPSRAMATKTSPTEDNRDEMKANCAPTTSPSNQLLENDQENPPLGPGLYMVPKERLKSFLREETIGAGGSMSSSTSVFHGFQSRDLVRPRALTELGERVAKGARAKSPVKSPVIDLTQFSPSPEKARPAPQVPSVKTAMPTPSGVDRRPSVPCETPLGWSTVENC